MMNLSQWVSQDPEVMSGAVGRWFPGMKAEEQATLKAAA
jgi:hypothetical protein